MAEVEAQPCARRFDDGCSVERELVAYQSPVGSNSQWRKPFPELFTKPMCLLARSCLAMYEGKGRRRNRPPYRHERQNENVGYHGRPCGKDIKAVLAAGKLIYSLTANNNPG